MSPGVLTVGVDAAKVVPVVQHGEDEFEVVFLGVFDGGVEAGDPAGGVVVDADGLRDVVEELVVDGLVGWCVGVAEGPHSRDL